MNFRIYRTDRHDFFHFGDGRLAAMAMMGFEILAASR